MVDLGWNLESGSSERNLQPSRRTKPRRPACNLHSMYDYERWKYNIDIRMQAEQYRTDRKTFDKRAAEYVAKYAS